MPRPKKTKTQKAEISTTTTSVGSIVYLTSEGTAGTVCTTGFSQAMEPKVQPLTQEFGNGDMNVLRDKLNEIIKAI